MQPSSRGFGVRRAKVSGAVLRCYEAKSGCLYKLGVLLDGVVLIRACGV